jgi:hypothetical protein
MTPTPVVGYLSLTAYARSFPEALFIFAKEVYEAYGQCLDRFSSREPWYLWTVIYLSNVGVCAYVFVKSK